MDIKQLRKLTGSYFTKTDAFWMQGREKEKKKGLTFCCRGNYNRCSIDEGFKKVSVTLSLKIHNLFYRT